jgi:hypothetical protein
VKSLTVLLPGGLGHLLIQYQRIYHQLEVATSLTCTPEGARGDICVLGELFGEGWGTDAGDGLRQKTIVTTLRNRRALPQYLCDTFLQVCSDLQMYTSANNR